VGGKIAQIGQRLVDMAAQKMAAEFFQNFNRQLEVLYPAAQPQPQPSVAPSQAPEAGGWWARIKAFFAGLGARPS
jgi:hypothetical protein